MVPWYCSTWSNQLIMICLLVLERSFNQLHTFLHTASHSVTAVLVALLVTLYSYCVHIGVLLYYYR